MGHKILYFVKGGVPNERQQAEIASLGAFVRNASACGTRDFCETCDGVAGDVPEAYGRLYPVVVCCLKKTDSKPAVDGLDALTVAQLRSFAQDKGIGIPPTIKVKGDIVAFIRSAVASSEQESAEQEPAESEKEPAEQ